MAGWYEKPFMIEIDRKPSTNKDNQRVFLRGPYHRLRLKFYPVGDVHSGHSADIVVVCLAIALGREPRWHAGGFRIGDCFVL